MIARTASRRCAPLYCPPRIARGLHSVSPLAGLTPPRKIARVAGHADLSRLQQLLEGDAKDPWLCRVSTQLPIVIHGEVRRPDLELAFSRPSEPRPQEVRIWVEVKHGTAPHTQQLGAYVDALRDRDRYGAVVLVAPRRDIPFSDAEVPKSVAQLSWQETAAIIAGYGSSTDTVGQFLIREVCDYLREENLMDPQSITPVLLVALEHREPADEAIKRICEIAADQVSAWTGEPRNPGNPYGLGFWEVVDRQAPKSQEPADWGVWWDWSLKASDLGIPEARGGVPVFTAGLATKRRGPRIADGPDGAAWAGRLEDTHGFVRAEDDRARFIRYAYPDEVLTGRSLEEQGKRLGDWVAETFEVLYEAHPPQSYAPRG